MEGVIKGDNRRTGIDDAEIGYRPLRAVLSRDRDFIALLYAAGNEEVSYLINLSIPSLKQVTPYNSSATEDVIVTVPKSATDAYFSWNRTVPANYTFRDFLVNGQSIYDVSAETGGQLYYIKGDVELELVFFETEYFVLTYDEPEGGEIIIEVYDYFDMNIGDYTARPYETGEPIATGTKYRVTFYADEEHALTGAYVNDEKVFEAPATDEAVCVIDLDTIMPGTILFDTGDMIRTACSTAEEDEKDLSKVSFSTEMYKSLIGGYREIADSFLTSEEKDWIKESGRTITQIMAVRFLTDYIAGDVYYNIAYPEHNIVRAHTQIALMKSMDAQWQNF